MVDQVLSGRRRLPEKPHVGAWAPGRKDPAQGGREQEVCSEHIGTSSGQDGRQPEDPGWVVMGL